MLCELLVSVSAKDQYWPEGGCNSVPPTRVSWTPRRMAFMSKWEMSNAFLSFSLSISTGEDCCCACCWPGGLLSRAAMVMTMMLMLLV